MPHHERWTRPSPVTEPGSAGADIDALPADVAALRRVSSNLVFHYRGGGDFAENGIAAERISEIDSRYADVMFDRLRELGGSSLFADRVAAQRVVGCCRDFTVLFVAMAQRRGLAARARAGFATYFDEGWFIDHVIAELWDSSTGRWRLVEPQVSDGFARQAGFDPLDVPSGAFLTAGEAWLQCRAGEADPDRFVVAPHLDFPPIKGWRFLRHHLLFDLAALNKREMLLWDGWGLMMQDDPPGTEESLLLDDLARVISGPDPSPSELQDWGRREGLAVPSTVLSFKEAFGEPRPVDVSRVVGGDRTSD